MFCAFLRPRLFRCGFHCVHHSANRQAQFGRSSLLTSNRRPENESKSSDGKWRVVFLLKSDARNAIRERSRRAGERPASAPVKSYVRNDGFEAKRNLLGYAEKLAWRIS